MIFFDLNFSQLLTKFTNVSSRIVLKDSLEYLFKFDLVNEYELAINLLELVLGGLPECGGALSGDACSLAVNVARIPLVGALVVLYPVSLLCFLFVSRYMCMYCFYFQTFD